MRPKTAESAVRLAARWLPWTSRPSGRAARFRDKRSLKPERHLFFSQYLRPRPTKTHIPRFCGAAAPGLAPELAWLLPPLTTLREVNSTVPKPCNFSDSSVSMRDLRIRGFEMARPPLLPSSKGAVPLHGPTQDVENSALGPASRIFYCLETEKSSFVAGITHPCHAIANGLGLNCF
jgi:hypothetical protein